MGSFDSLPDDVMRHTLQYVTYRERFRNARVFKQWRDLTYNTKHFPATLKVELRIGIPGCLDLCSIEFPEEFTATYEPSIPLQIIPDTLIRQVLSSVKFAEYWTQAEPLDHLDESELAFTLPERCKVFLKNLKNVESLLINEFNSQEVNPSVYLNYGLSEAMNKCKKLEAYMASSAFALMKARQQFNLNEIKLHGFATFIEFNQRIFPNLNTIILNYQVFFCFGVQSNVWPVLGAQVVEVKIIIEDDEFPDLESMPDEMTFPPPSFYGSVESLIVDYSSRNSEITRDQSDGFLKFLTPSFNNANVICVWERAPCK